MRKRVRVFVVLLAALGNGIPLRAQLKTQNVVLIVSDGLRWQEVFTGADPDLISEKHGGIWASPEKLRSQFWSGDPAVGARGCFPSYGEWSRRMARFSAIRIKAALRASQMVWRSPTPAITRC